MAIACNEAGCISGRGGPCQCDCCRRWRAERDDWKARAERAEDCMRIAGLQAFIRDGDRKPEEVAEHLRRVLDSYDEHERALRDQLAETTARGLYVERGGDRLAEALRLAQGEVVRLRTEVERITERAEQYRTSCNGMIRRLAEAEAENERLRAVVVWARGAAVLLSRVSASDVVSDAWAADSYRERFKRQRAGLVAALAALDAEGGGDG